jgi:hypothetical protein
MEVLCRIPISKGLHAGGYSHLFENNGKRVPPSPRACMLAGILTCLRITASEFPLREGGRPKAGGWIRLGEAGPAKQGQNQNWDLRKES